MNHKTGGGTATGEDRLRSLTIAVRATEFVRCRMILLYDERYEIRLQLVCSGKYPQQFRPRFDFEM